MRTSVALAFLALLSALLFGCGITTYMYSGKIAQCQIEFSHVKGQDTVVITEEYCKGPVENLLKAGTKIAVYLKYQNFKNSLLEYKTMIPSQIAGDIVWGNDARMDDCGIYKNVYLPKANKSSKRSKSQLADIPERRHWEHQTREHYYNIIKSSSFIKSHDIKILHPCGQKPLSLPLDGILKIYYFDKKKKMRAIRTEVSPQHICVKEDIEKSKQVPFFKKAKIAHIFHFWLHPDANTIAPFGFAEHQNLAQILGYKLAGIAEENSHFINWIRHTPIATFSKLFARIQGPITFPLHINLYSEKSFNNLESQKFILLCHDEWPNANFFFISYMYWFFSAISAIVFLASFFVARSQKIIKGQISDIWLPLPITRQSYS